MKASFFTAAAKRSLALLLAAGLLPVSAPVNALTPLRMPAAAASSALPDIETQALAAEPFVSAAHVSSPLQRHLRHVVLSAIRWMPEGMKRSFLHWWRGGVLGRESDAHSPVEIVETNVAKTEPSAAAPIAAIATSVAEPPQTPAPVLRIPRMSDTLDSDIRLAFDVVTAFDPAIRPAMAYILEPGGLETVGRMAQALEPLLILYPEITEPAVLFAVDFLWYWSRRWPEDIRLQSVVDDALNGWPRTFRLSMFLQPVLVMGIPELYEKIQDLQMFVAQARGMERLSQRLSDRSVFARTLLYSERLMSKYLKEKTHPLWLAGLWEFVLDVGWLERHVPNVKRQPLYELVLRERILREATLRALADTEVLTLERIRQVEHKILTFIAADARQLIPGEREGEFLFDYLESMRKRPLPERLAIDVNHLDLSVRTYNCFMNEHLTTIGLILTKSEAELHRIKNFGDISMNELKGKLKKLDLPFPDPDVTSTANLEYIRGLPLAERLAVEITKVVMSVRSFNALKNAGYHTLGQIAVKTEAELLRVDNFGEVSLNELKIILGKLDLHLPGSAKPPNPTGHSA